MLKARAVYCPLDSGLSPDLRTSYLKNAGSRILLTGTNSEKPLLLDQDVQIIVIEDILLTFIDFPPSKPPKLEYEHGEKLRENAYLCFTSGSSGNPKGVMCTHKGLVAFQSNIEVRLFAQPGRKIGKRDRLSLLILFSPYKSSWA